MAQELIVAALLLGPRQHARLGSVPGSLAPKLGNPESNGGEKTTPMHMIYIYIYVYMYIYIDIDMSNCNIYRYIYIHRYMQI